MKNDRCRNEMQTMMQNVDALCLLCRYRVEEGAWDCAGRMLCKEGECEKEEEGKEKEEKEEEEEEEVVWDDEVLLAAQGTLKANGREGDEMGRIRFLTLGYR